MSYDAVIIGSGPNGLAAAITLAQAGQRVLVVEEETTPGGGMRTQELTLPGFHHDICSAIHPLGVASPFFRSLPLADYGLEWILPPVSLARPLDDGTVVAVMTSLDETAAGLGVDGRAWRWLFEPLVARWERRIAHPQKASTFAHRPHCRAAAYMVRAATMPRRPCWQT
ncbi:MAG: FAD-dependent oxidoreductase, partial [Caldilinea sp.]